MSRTITVENLIERICYDLNTLKENRASQEQISRYLLKKSTEMLSRYIAYDREREVKVNV